MLVYSKINNFSISIEMCHNIAYRIGARFHDSIVKTSDKPASKLQNAPHFGEVKKLHLNDRFSLIVSLTSMFQYMNNQTKNETDEDNSFHGYLSNFYKLHTGFRQFTKV